jgi:hypothetical protein
MENETILKNSGFFELPTRMLWVSHEQRKAFSRDVLRDHDSRWLHERLSEKVPETRFFFYFNVIPKNFKEESLRILAEIGEPDLQPVAHVGVTGTKRTLLIAPFSSAAKEVGETVRKGLQDLGLEVVRLDQMPAGAPSANAFIDAIRTSDFIVVDVTEGNPNVYYELGIAHGFSKPTIIMVSDKSSNSIPSDLSGVLYVVYNPDDLSALSRKIKYAAQAFL